MDVFVRVRSEYFNAELSIHRLNMSGLTLIPSLQQQTDRDFHLVLEYVENDPHLMRRLHHWNGFRRVEEIPEIDRVEVFVDDDVFLHQRFIQTCRRAAMRDRIPRTLAFSNGYVLRNGQLFQASRMTTVAFGVVQRGEAGQNGTSALQMVTQHPSWVYVDHVNKVPVANLHLHQEETPLLTRPWWRGFSAELVDECAQTTAILATADGYDVFPEHRQMVFAKKGGSANKGRR